MCQIVSVAVHPTTCEVFHVPGVWHHHEICSKIGIAVDKMFDPEIHLDAKKITFDRTSLRIAFNHRTLPDELRLSILKELDADPTNLDLEFNGVYRWGNKHQSAVYRWMSNNIPTARALMKFSEETWMPKHYAGTVVDREINHLLENAEPDSPREDMLLRRLWEMSFEKESNRVRCWR